MILRGKLSPLILLVLVSVSSVFTLSCHLTEYQIGTECCPMCPPGSRVKTDCTEIRNTSCLRCSDGTYTDKPSGLRRCHHCSTCDSGSGLKVKSPCSLTSDAVCETTEGFFCIDSTGSGCSAAQRHRSCEPGQYISKTGTSSTDTECSDCNNGTFSDGSLTSCQLHTQCETKNLQLIKAGTTSTDSQCGEKSSAGRITGIIVGSILVLGIIICGVCYLWRSKRRKTYHFPGRVLS